MTEPPLTLQYEGLKRCAMLRTHSKLPILTKPLHLSCTSALYVLAIHIS
jgi:hypothetical protein